MIGGELVVVLLEVMSEVVTISGRQMGSELVMISGRQMVRRMRRRGGGGGGGGGEVMDGQ